MLTTNPDCVPTRAARVRTCVLLVAAAAGAVLLLAACGGSSDHSQTTATHAASSAGAQPTAESTQAAKFSQCMRAHGEPDFPDPNAKGQIQLMVTKGGSLDPQSATYKSALQACKSLQPAGFGSDSTQSTANQTQVLQFVDCMRKHGVPNMPDPQSNGTMRIQGINPNSPTFQSAMQTCRSYLPAGAAGG